MALKPLDSVKVVVLGDSSAGKTAILRRFFHDSFGEDGHATIGIDFLHRLYYLQDQKPIRLQVWDTAGQERFRQLIPAYIRDAAVAIVVFDLTDPQAPLSIARWVRYVYRERGDRTYIYLVGNKSDMKQRCITPVMVKKMLECYELPYFETSAMTGENIELLFESIAHMPFPQHKTSISDPIKLYRRPSIAEQVSDQVSNCSCG